MATSTIYDNVVIRDKVKCKKLLNALENAKAEKASSKPRPTVSDMTKTQMDQIFKRPE